MLAEERLVILVLGFKKGSFGERSRVWVLPLRGSLAALGVVPGEQAPPARGLLTLQAAMDTGAIPGFAEQRSGHLQLTAACPAPVRLGERFHDLVLRCTKIEGCRAGLCLNPRC